MNSAQASRPLPSVSNQYSIPTLTSDARSTLDDLLVDEGYSGGEVLEDVLTVARSRYGETKLARLHRLAGGVDMDLHEGTNINRY